MKRYIARLLILGCLGFFVLLGAISAYGQGSVQTYLPLMARRVPFPPDPPLSGYLGLVHSESDGDLDYYTVRADGTGWTNITSNDMVDYGGVWSVDGKYLYYLNDDGRWLAHTDTAQSRLLAPEGTPFTEFSPDSRYFAFGVIEYEPYSIKYFILNLATDTQIELPILGDFHALGWSPTSQGAVMFPLYNERPNFWVFQADGSARRLIDSGYGLAMPVWSSDGQHILFTNWELVGTDIIPAVYSMTMDGEPVRLVGGYRAVRWLDGGRKLLLQTEAPELAYYIADADGTNVTLFSASGQSIYNSLSVSPDEQQVLYYVYPEGWQYRSLSDDTPVTVPSFCTPVPPGAYCSQGIPIWSEDSRTFYTTYEVYYYNDEPYPPPPPVYVDRGWRITDATTSPPEHIETWSGSTTPMALPLSGQYISAVSYTTDAGDRTLIIDRNRDWVWQVPLQNDSDYVEQWRYVP